MDASITPYTSLITSEHADKVDFMATVAALVQPVANIKAAVDALPTDFDVDTAIGSQLDVVGLWVGQSRYVGVTLAVYFSFNTPGLGFNQGVWKGPFDPTTGLTALQDDTYRSLLLALIARNQWDGTVAGAQGVMRGFLGADAVMTILDNSDMSIELGAIGSGLDAARRALFAGGYIDVKSAGVRVTDHITPSVPGTPFFGFGPETPSIGGFGSGSWKTSLEE